MVQNRKLTASQTEVLRRTQAGERDREIAEALRLTVGSVRNVKQQIRRRTGEAVRRMPRRCLDCQRLAEQAAQLEAAVRVWRAVAEAFERRCVGAPLPPIPSIPAKEGISAEPSEAAKL